MSQRKRMKISDTTQETKRGDDTEDKSNKRLKSENATDNELTKIQTMKRKNFVTACEQVSYKAYFDLHSRFQLVYLPTCIDRNVCKHNDLNGPNITQIPSYAEESFKIEMKTNMWYEALEVCQMCITPVQYLPSTILKDIVEIILNAHDDDYREYTITYLIDKCQQILGQNFSFHPPCHSKKIRKCYNDFLMSPMDEKENTFTNRKEFGCDKGIVKYCMQRLEHEISPESKDEALINKYENIPEEMKQSVKGLHWQKEKFEIFELLERPERIKRLMVVLESIIELLQFDLAIWHSRYTNNLGSHIMRSHKPLMAYILWSNYVLYTGAVTNNCRQILKLFVNFIHLEYPEEYIKIMTTWLNAIVQTFYICETNSNSDYPHLEKYSKTFANELHKIISAMPHKTIIRVLERIQPSFMQYLVGTQYIKTLLTSKEDDIIKILIIFIKNAQWQLFPEGTCDIEISKKLEHKSIKVKSILHYLSKKCNAWKTEKISETPKNIYHKLEADSIQNYTEFDANHVVHTLYITLKAYFDCYSVQTVQDTLDKLNEQLLANDHIMVNLNNSLSEITSYSVTEQFIKKYRSIYQTLKELMSLLLEMKNAEGLPEILKVFENTGLLGL